MANVAHKTLTGTDLHEPKGVTGASDGDVYIADGANSGAWAAKGPQVAIVTYTVADGTEHPAGTAATWTASPINTEDSDADSLITLASNQITITNAGTYLIKARRTFGQGALGGRIRIRNTTDSTTLGSSLSGFVGNLSGGSINVETSVIGVETITASKVYEIQYFVNTAGAGQLGEDDNETAGSEVFLVAEIWKLK